MQASKNFLFDHIKLLRAAVSAAGAEALMAFDSMNVFVRRGSSHWVFHPKFMAESEGVRRYTYGLTEDTTMFAGWLPYQVKRWPIASDKLAFKRYAKSAGLDTPECWLEGGSAKDVIAKRPGSSFGAQIKGPFRESGEHALDVAQGEYFERFIQGRILKIWFWEETPVCAELDQMPTVTGDGKSKLAELIVRRANQIRGRTDDEKRDLVAASEPVLRYFGRTPADILERGTRQLIEFRYGTTLMYPGERRNIDLMQPAGEAWAGALPEIGRKLAAAIPPEARTHTLYTVDAILDSDDRLWLLEMNCNPTVHPLVYPVMMRRMLAERTSSETVAESIG